MRVLIVDNEIYLAGSIATKLADIGYECDIARNVKEALKDEKYDVVLLSTTLSGQDFYPVIEKHKGSIIILLIAYISNDTVSKPMLAGASDYIQKPFMIEELVRKINHLSEHKNMQNMLVAYQTYIQNALKCYKTQDIDPKKLKFPLLIKTNKTEYADSFVFELTKQTKGSFKYIIAQNLTQTQKELISSECEYIYISEAQNLNQNEIEKLLSLSQRKKLILSSTNFNLNIKTESIEILANESHFSIDEIATIDDYIKHIINMYQDKYPDTELSKRLGISRKSLWEKRKKYEITKKK
ncbi:response regulator [Campylobacter majalis]|uniref:response regulator n=1 Tax=Campylobacter majalis TaxID=2790656 RepID=UPI003D69CDE0